MDNFNEPPFLINGVKSWIHCLSFNLEGNPDKKPTYHYHDYIEFLYFIRTSGWLWVNGKKYKFTPGDLAVVNSNEAHDLVFDGHAEYICVKFSPQILYSDEQALYEFKYMIPFLLENAHQKIFHADEIPDADALCRSIIEEWEGQDCAYELMIRANILKLFSQILRYLRRKNEPELQMRISDPMKKAFAYISEHYDTATERQTAQVCGLSYNHFSYAFKKLTGKTFCEYLTRVKITQSEKLLLSSDKSITEIAFLTGFSSSSHFTARFKKLKGITPLKFRERVKKEAL